MHGGATSHPQDSGLAEVACRAVTAPSLESLALSFGVSAFGLEGLMGSCLHCHHQLRDPARFTPVLLFATDSFTFVYLAIALATWVRFDGDGSVKLFRLENFPFGATLPSLRPLRHAGCRRPFPRLLQIYHNFVYFH